MPVEIKITGGLAVYYKRSRSVGFWSLCGILSVLLMKDSVLVNVR